MSMIDKSQHFWEMVRFGLVGVLNTIVGYGSYWVFLRLDFHYLVAMVGSHILGMTNSYFWNKYWTFKSLRKSHAEKIKFVTVYAVTFLLNGILLMLLVEKFSFSEELAGLIALFVVMLVSYLGHKLWSFKQ